jgi:hypothetical protein
MSRYRAVSFGLLILLVSSSTYLAAQPPRKEEEEDTPKQKDKEKARPAVPVPVAEPEKKDAPPGNPEGVDADIGSFAQEMAKATHPVARELFKFLIVPYDRIDANFKGGAIYRIELLQLRELPEGELEVKVLAPNGKESKEMKFPAGNGFKYIPFELVVLEQVDKFLEKDSTLDPLDKLNYAARAVASGLRWHLLAVNANKRVGKEWEPVAKQLRDRHLALLRQRFEAMVKAGMYKNADELGLKMLARYPDNNDVLRDVYGLQLRSTKEAIKSPTDADLLKIRESLLLYEKLPGKKEEGLITDSRKMLRDRAAALIAEAKDLDSKKMTAAALAKLRTAELLDPELPGIGDARISLKGKVLYVGVSKLPEKMSPATAETDSEHWACELMFEGLLQTIPDKEVTRYRPALAETMPAVMPLGRSFTLPRNIRWGKEGVGIVDARDVRGTLDLLRRPAYRDRWCADGLDVFEEIDRIRDPFKLRLAYRQGVLEPLGRATFKVLPAQWLQTQGKAADDDAFARAPFGTGPFVYAGREREGMDRESAVFRANPYYSQRDGKLGLPLIREIRFIVPNQSTVAADVAGGQLHVYPDPPDVLVPRFRGDMGLKDSVRVSVAATNRRIHLLAVNHRKSSLQNATLRQGLSAAINREAILKDIYRPNDPKAHHALTGPFPLRCWATPATAREAPLYKAGAGGLIAEGLAGRTIKLQMVYVEDDPKEQNPKRQKICQAMKGQIEEASTKNGMPTVEIEVVAMTPERFHEKVHLEGDYDLALTTFDYRDDLYSLSSLLDPEATSRGSRNYMGYLGEGTNPTDADRRLRKLMEEVRQYRDFSKQVKEKTWDIHALFNQRVPFIPLWQLDRYLVTHRDLDVFVDNPNVPVNPERLDPAIVFTGVEMWRLK